MSNLPSAVYATSAMSTAGRTAIVATTGSVFGNFTVPRRIIPPALTDYYLEYTYQITGSSVLPSIVYGTSAMVTAVRTVVLATSGTVFGRHARVYKLSIVLPQSQIITVTAYPTLLLTPGTRTGEFAAYAYPTVGITPGLTIFTASPRAAFTGINNVYTSMDFTAVQYPRAGYSFAVPNGFTGRMFPKEILFTPLGQSARCVAGSGSDPCAGAGGTAQKSRYWKPLQPTR